MGKQILGAGSLRRSVLLIGVNSRHFLQGSFPGDELPALKFSALLMENGTERLELTRA